MFPSVCVCEVTQPICQSQDWQSKGSTSNRTRHQQSHAHTHTKAFNSALVECDGLDFVTMEFVNIPVNMPLEVHQTTQGTTTKITPVTRTPTGMEVLRKRCDLWTFSNQGYLVRTHRTQRKALFAQDQQCPVPTERLENFRRTLARRSNGNNETIEDAYQTLDAKQ